MGSINNTFGIKGVQGRLAPQVDLDSPSEISKGTSSFKLGKILDRDRISGQCCYRLEESNDFAEHCLFFKSIEDANRLRRQIAESFERAALPGIPAEVHSSTKHQAIATSALRQQHQTALMTKMMSLIAEVEDEMVTSGNMSQMLQEKQQRLTFVIVGGGPTGVEVAAELYDMISEDLKNP